jgi:hypothetical protein
VANAEIGNSCGACTIPRSVGPEIEERIVRLRKTLIKRGLDAGAETIAAHLATDSSRSRTSMVVLLAHDAAQRHKPEFFIGDEARRGVADGWSRVRGAHRGPGVAGLRVVALRVRGRCAGRSQPR